MPTKKGSPKNGEPAGRTEPGVLTPAAPPETISKEDFRKEIKNINDILKNPEEPTEKKGLLLRSIVDRIVYEKSSGTMYFDFFVS